ncbi:MAG: cryptic adenine deaminase [Methanomassiliicoccales archaeon PtaU1.Bin124]|nr:MAG: cryptic adenine deaminase [Methanomassiliicoccales archaeon PtaU1.Bin124]
MLIGPSWQKAIYARRTANLIMNGSVKGNFVDVVSGKVFPAQVDFQDGKIKAVTEISEPQERFILPGLIDAHIHVESSQLCPSRFAEIAVTHGTTAVVCDPHEIANVQGMTGIRYMIEDASRSPLRFHFTAPSCVPSTVHETNGAKLGKPEVEKLLAMKEVVALGEVMDHMAVLRDDPEMMDKIKAAKFQWKPIDGHCPGLRGKDLAKYFEAGISSDHECLSAGEAEEKYHLGMWIMAREGSGHKNLRDLLPFIKRNEFMLVSDDIQAVDLLEGHMDNLLRKAVLMGVNPVHAIRAATAWPAWHYFLPLGVLQPGKPADIVIVDDLREFRVHQVYIAGRLVAEDGKALFQVEPVKGEASLRRQDRRPEEFAPRAEGRTARVRVIKALPDQIESYRTFVELEAKDGNLLPDVDKDVLVMAVVNRYAPAPPALAFVTGFGLKKGAMASTVAHDSHNIIVVGADLDAMAEAVNRVSRKGGYIVFDGIDERSVSLDVAGLMSTSSAVEVAGRTNAAVEMLRGMGCKLPSPFATLSFQSLLVVPELKLSDKGLFDSRQMKFVDLVVS